MCNTHLIINAYTGAAIELYVCPFCLRADALRRVKDQEPTVDGWWCTRCRTANLYHPETGVIPTAN
jgi:ribosomal protein L37AE/L43A